MFERVSGEPSPQELVIDEKGNRVTGDALKEYHENRFSQSHFLPISRISLFIDPIFSQRFRCRHCSCIFCANCKAVPYHLGLTCKSFRGREKGEEKICRFCEKSLSAEHRSWQEVNGLIEMLKVYELAKGVKPQGSWTYSVSDKPVTTSSCLSMLHFLIHSFPFAYFLTPVLPLFPHQVDASSIFYSEDAGLSARERMRMKMDRLQRLLNKEGSVAPYVVAPFSYPALKMLVLPLLSCRRKRKRRKKGRRKRKRVTLVLCFRYIWTVSITGSQMSQTLSPSPFISSCGFALFIALSNRHDRKFLFYSFHRRKMESFLFLRLLNLPVNSEIASPLQSPPLSKVFRSKTLSLVFGKMERNKKRVCDIFRSNSSLPNIDLME